MDDLCARGASLEIRRECLTREENILQFWVEEKIDGANEELGGGRGFLYSICSDFSHFSEMERKRKLIGIKNKRGRGRRK